ncbi:MAG: DNA ligase D, partial [Limnobacter sp.]|nr:DNA ligase D [Limnobacter sp.]
QEHHARRLHYDFRLELDGTLKSWAVPKGPSMDPSIKRMAVHVEDHPLSYAHFEGVIPPKQYGAGTVSIWDRGTWIPEGDPKAGYRDGKLEFELRGERLSGRWVLVRTGSRSAKGGDKESWLLMKRKDDDGKSSSADRSALRDGELPDGARRASLPRQLSPQLASLVAAPPSNGDWAYEPKFDGYRLLVRIDGDDVRCFTRTGKDWTDRLPALAETIRSMNLGKAWLDGELVAIGANGVPDFQALQNAFDGRGTEALDYFAFDLPCFDGYDLRDCALSARRELLASVLGKGAARVHFSESFDADPASLLEAARRSGLEGLIGKRRGSPYRSRRSSDWIKLKTGLRQEFVVVGFTDPKGSREALGSLLLAVNDETGKLRYAGNVGSGFDNRTLAALGKQLAALRVDRSALAAPPKRVGARGDMLPRWVEPKLVAEVSFAGWTRSGSVRQAVFRGLRDDKSPSEIRREEPEAPPSASSDSQAPAASARSAPRPRARATQPARSGKAASRTIESVRITSAERIVDALTGFTKGELVDYYARAAEAMLPHLKGRPVSLLRAPQGVDGEFFFQRHAESTSLPHVKTLPKSLYPDHDPLLEISTRKALLSAAQMNAIEFHTWNATTRAIGKPDRMVFDLDPGQGVEWDKVLEAAGLVRAMLDELSLASLLKTSGGKGLHVVVPLARRLDHDKVKAVSKAIVEHLAKVIPQRFVAKSGPRNRVGRIFIDYLRNGFSATTVAAWSVRARPGLGVSVPVGWDELDALTSGAHWTVENIDERLAIGNAPWDALRASRQGLGKAIEVLGLGAL